MATGDFDVCVVGAGLVGSAAAKYVSESGTRTLLIGPPEPQCKETEDVFGAYFDEGRITRTLDVDPVWAMLANKSIQRYRHIERTSGVQFFTENGFMAIGKPGSHFIQDNVKTAKAQNVALKTLASSTDIESTFSLLSLSHGFVGLLEEKNAGSINPRLLRKAQISLAKKNGCTYVEDIVTQVSRKDAEFWAITTKTYNSFRARSVLLCPGAFVNHFSLLPLSVRTRPIDLRNIATCVLMIKVNNPIHRQQLSNMPCFMMQKSINTETITQHTSHPSFLFFMPPFQFSDGNWYFKFGDSDLFWRQQLHSAQEVSEWYRSGAGQCVEDGKQMAAAAKRHFPMVDVSEYHVEVCVVTMTSSGRAYIDQLAERLFLSTGGNGFAAKSSDEIGRLSARLATKQDWHSDVDKSTFACKFISLL